MANWGAFLSTLGGELIKINDREDKQAHSTELQNTKIAADDARLDKQITANSKAAEKKQTFDLKYQQQGFDAADTRQTALIGANLDMKKEGYSQANLVADRQIAATKEEGRLNREQDATQFNEGTRRWNKGFDLKKDDVTWNRLFKENKYYSDLDNEQRRISILEDKQLQDAYLNHIDRELKAYELKGLEEVDMLYQDLAKMEYNDPDRLRVVDQLRNRAGKYTDIMGDSIKFASSVLDLQNTKLSKMSRKDGNNYMKTMPGLGDLMTAAMSFRRGEIPDPQAWFNQELGGAATSVPNNPNNLPNVINSAEEYEDLPKGTPYWNAKDGVEGIRQ